MSEIAPEEGQTPEELKRLFAVVRTNGIASNTSDPVFSSAWNNRFDNNTYILGTGSTYYYGPSGAVTKAAWQALGQDLHSTRDQ